MLKFESDLIPVFEDNLTKFAAGRDEAIKLGLEGKQKEAYEKFNAIKDAENNFHQNLNDLGTYNQNAANEIYNQNEKDYASSMKLFIEIIIISILFSFAATFIISRNITSALKEVINHLKFVATGDFTIKIPDKFKKRKDEIGDVAKSMDIMQCSVNSLIKNVKNEAEAIANIVSTVNYNVT